MNEDEVEQLIGTGELDGLPEWLTDLFEMNEPCAACGEETVAEAFNLRDSPYVCYACGEEFGHGDIDGRPSFLDVFLGRNEDDEEEKSEEITESSVEVVDPDSGPPKKSAGAKVVNVIGYLCMLTGILLIITLIGIPLGIVFIIGGGILASYGG